MSYELTQYRTFSQHDPDCIDCTKLRPRTHIHVDSLAEELRKNRLKKVVMERNVRETSLVVADLERRIRLASSEGRTEYKYQLSYRLSTHAGLLHMLLRYGTQLRVHDVSLENII